MPTISHWRLSNNNSTGEKRLAAELGINHLISHILINRNIETPDEAKKFLFPSLKDLHNPFLLKDMDKGVNRVIDAIVRGQKITVYGDYDADGITSTVILVKFLKECYDNVAFYIPDRIKGGVWA